MYFLTATCFGPHGTIFVVLMDYLTKCMLVTHNRMHTVKKLILSFAMNVSFEVLMAMTVKIIVSGM
jgi:hypothetical protein